MALSIKRGGAMFMHKNRKYVIENRRSYSRRASDTKCENATCEKKGRTAFWTGVLATSRQKRRTDEERGERAKVPPHCCRLKYYTDRKDPDLSELGGQAYRTCGPAYLVQRDLLPRQDDEPTKEERILKRIEAHPALKEFVDDPLPDIRDVPRKLLQLSDVGLHPNYRKLRSTPPPKSRKGRSKRGVATEDAPAVRVRVVGDAIERKNLNVEYKRTSPP